MPDLQLIGSLAALAHEVHSSGVMECQYCGKSVSLIRVLIDSEYCCENHRWTHLEELNRLGLAVLMRQVCAPKLGDLSAELGPAAEFFASGVLPAADGQPDLDPDDPDGLATWRLGNNLERSSG